MRRTGVILASVVGASLIIGSTSAAAYVDVGYDPQGDSTNESGAYDIRSSVRSVVEGPHGQFLRVAARTNDADFWAGSYIYIDARLDARGGRAADAILHMWILDMSGSGCELQSRSGRLLRRGVLRFVGEPTQQEDDDADFYEAVACRVRVHRLHSTKPIRWNVSFIYGNGEPVFDVAPNVGMYG